MTTEPKSDAKCHMGALSIPCREYIHEVLRLNLEPLRVELNAAKEAVSKAEMTLGIRLEGMNEFRTAMKDQVETFLPRDEAVATFATKEGVGALTSSLKQLWIIVVMLITIGATAIVGMAALMIQLSK